MHAWRRSSSFAFYWCILIIILASVPSSISGQQNDNPSLLPIPDLPLGEINVLVLTDTHSWVGGHGPNEPELNANYGDVVSFYERLYDYCQSVGKDLYFVMNGDWIDGTGLSLNGDAFSLTQILEQMPWDALNVGNHELYHAPVIDYITQPGSFVDWWGDRYLSSNIILNATMEPLGNRYVVMRGRNTNVLTFGFLYNMKNHVDSVTVEEVESVVEEQWFIDALHKETYDAILVLAHMDVTDPLVHVILNKTRQEIGDDMPVQFVTGHTHIRAYAILDEFSTSFEAGRFLNTLGFVSFSKHDTIKQRNMTSDAFTTINGEVTDSTTDLTSNSTTDFTSYDTDNNVTANFTTDAITYVTNNSTAFNFTTTAQFFQYKYLDANKENFRQILGVDALPTNKGASLSKFIQRVRDEKGLNVEIGCVDKTYYFANATYIETSLWGYFSRNIAPKMFQEHQVTLLQAGGLRYNLIAGVVRLDDAIAVSPFNDSLYKWSNVPSEVIDWLNFTLNGGENATNITEEFKYVLASPKPFIATNMTYELVTGEFETKTIQEKMAEIDPDFNGSVPERMNQTTTSIWVDYIRQYSPCDNSHDNSHGQRPHQRPSQHNPPSMGSTASGSENSNNDGDDSVTDSDEVRLVFVLVAVLVVIVLGSVHIWQRDKHFQRYSAAQEQATLDALKEYSYGSDFVAEDDMIDPEPEESEGRFV